MARKVKLQDTGEYSTSNIAYRGDNGKYYSSKDAFDKYNNNKEYRQKCIDLMFDVLGYKNNMIIPTYFYKSLTKFDGVGYEALYNTMIRQDKSVQWALKTKNFSGETAKVMYIMAIYNNNVMDEYKLLCSTRKTSATANDKSEPIEEFISTKNAERSNVMSLVGDLDE